MSHDFSFSFSLWCDLLQCRRVLNYSTGRLDTTGLQHGQTLRNVAKLLMNLLDNSVTICHAVRVQSGRTAQLREEK
jgi:hypothetical protein